MEAIPVFPESSPVLSVNGYLVTVSFSHDHNEGLTEQLKRILVSSYSEECADVEFAISQNLRYNDGGETCVP